MRADFRRRYGPWAIVTGASSGLGEGFVHALGARGLHLILVARRLDELKRVAAEVERDHAVSCVCVSVDLADADFMGVIEDAARGREPGAGNRWVTRLMRSLPRRWVVRLAEPTLRQMVSRLRRDS